MNALRSLPLLRRPGRPAARGCRAPAVLVAAALAALLVAAPAQAASVHLDSPPNGTLYEDEVGTEVHYVVSWSGNEDGCLPNGDSQEQSYNDATQQWDDEGSAWDRVGASGSLDHYHFLGGAEVDSATAQRYRIMFRCVANDGSLATIEAPSNEITLYFHALQGTNGDEKGPVDHCVVPHLKGKTVHGVKSALAAAKCSLGSVKKKKSKHGKRGRILSQKPAPGTVLDEGAKVSVVVRK
jgi:PASTA domain